MGLLTKDGIFGATDIVTERVSVPEWGGDVLIRGLTGKQRDAFEASMMERRGKTMVPNTNNIRARLVAWACVDEEGQRLFNDGDITELGEHSAGVLDRVYKVAAKLSGLSDDDVEELEGNFGETPGDGSSSHSPTGSASRSKKS